MFLVSLLIFVVVGLLVSAGQTSHGNLPWMIDMATGCAVCPSFLMIHRDSSWTDRFYVIESPMSWCHRVVGLRSRRATWARRTFRWIWAPNRPALAYSHRSCCIPRRLLIPNWPGHLDLLSVLQSLKMFSFEIGLANTVCCVVLRTHRVRVYTQWEAENICAVTETPSNSNDTNQNRTFCHINFQLFYRSFL